MDSWDVREQTEQASTQLLALRLEGLTLRRRNTGEADHKRIPGDSTRKNHTMNKESTENYTNSIETELQTRPLS